ncbi:unnamed protein product [Rhodiola kirilowii]
MKSSDVAHIGVYCQICGSPSHYADGCPVIGSDDNSGNQEDANYVGQNNQGAGPGYGPPTSRWDNPNRNNPNLSYKPQNPAPQSFPYKQQQGSAPYQPRGQYNNQAQQSQNSNSYQPRTQYNNQYNNQSQGQQNQNSGNYSYQPQQPKQQESDNSSSMEAMMAKFMADQDKKVKELQKTIDQLVTQNRMLETQVAQQANSATREHGKLPSKPEHNPRESVNAITLRSGKHLEMISAQDTRTGAAKSALNSALDEGETSKEAEN